MKQTVLSALLVTAVGAGLASAGTLPRAYFGATGPGSWAKYETTVPGSGKNLATYTRLEDENGGFVVEVVTEFLEGAGCWGRRSDEHLHAGPGLRLGVAVSSASARRSTGATFVMEGRPPMPQPKTDGGGDAGVHGGLQPVDSTRRERRRAVESSATCTPSMLCSAGRISGTMNGEVCLSRRGALRRRPSERDVTQREERGILIRDAPGGLGFGCTTLSAGAPDCRSVHRADGSKSQAV